MSNLLTTDDGEERMIDMDQLTIDHLDQELIRERKENVIRVMSKWFAYPYQFDETYVSLKNDADEGEGVKPSDALKEGIRRAVEQGDLPSEDSYFVTVFMSEIKRAIPMTPTELLDAYRETIESEPPRNLPSDGSKGQWRTAKSHRVTTYRWLLGLDALDPGDVPTLPTFDIGEKVRYLGENDEYHGSVYPIYSKTYISPIYKISIKGDKQHYLNGDTERIEAHARELESVE